MMNQKGNYNSLPEIPIELDQKCSLDGPLKFPEAESETDEITSDDEEMTLSVLNKKVGEKVANDFDEKIKDCDCVDTTIVELTSDFHSKFSVRCFHINI